MSLQKVIIRADGSTEPSIISGAEVLLIQQGVVKVGRFILEKDEYSDFYIEHPINAAELSLDAWAFVNQESDLLKISVSVIVICPESIANKMIWQNK
jgi:hypothetical protein